MGDCDLSGDARLHHRRMKKRNRREKTKASAATSETEIQSLRLLVPLRAWPSNSDIAVPQMTIQIRLLLAVKSCTARLHFGANRNSANISAAATVPRIPAKLPNRIATGIMTPKKIRGNKIRNELLLNRGVKQAAAMVHDRVPRNEDLNMSKKIARIQGGLNGFWLQVREKL